MLRAKAIGFRQGKAKRRDKMLTSTDTVGKLAGIPVVSQVVNAANRNKTVRKLLDKTLGVHADATVPPYHSDTLRKRLTKREAPEFTSQAGASTTGKVAVFATCYGNYNEPQMVEDLITVFEHNEIPVTFATKEQCCGMPKLELGDLEAVDRARQANIPELARLVDAGWDLVGPVPSCVLMFKQELPLMYPDDPEVLKVGKAFFDPFEYLMLRHKDGKLKTDFAKPLGKVAYHVACHQRVQRIGMKTRDALQLVPDTEIETIERCSGHDGTYAVKSECHDAAVKICRPVVSRVKQANVDHYTSDCVIAGHHIESGLADGREPEHPLSLLKLAYGL